MMPPVADGIPADTTPPDLKVIDAANPEPALPVQAHQYIKPQVGEDPVFFNYAQKLQTGIMLPPAPYQSAAVIPPHVQAYAMMQPQTDHEAVNIVRSAAASTFVLYNGKNPVTESSLNKNANQAYEQQDFSQKNNTALTSDQEAEYQRRIKLPKTDPQYLRDADNFDYDVRAWMLSGGKADERGHGSDVGKKPNHPTFSNQSVYSVKGQEGGVWAQDAEGNGTFTPSEWMAKDKPRMEALKKYMAKNEPDTKLILPEEKPIRFPMTVQGARQNATMPAVEKPTSGWDTFADFFKMENSIASIGEKNKSETGGYTDPSFDVTTEPAYKDPKYSAYRSQLISAPNKEAFQGRVQRIDSELATMQNAQGHGWSAFGGGALGALTDPVLWIGMATLNKLAPAEVLIGGARGAQIFEATKALQAAQKLAAAQEASGGFEALNAARLANIEAATSTGFLGAEEAAASYPEIQHGAKAVTEANTALEQLQTPSMAAHAAGAFVEGAGSEIAPEVIKQKTQFIRTPEQAAINIAAAGILNTVISAGVLHFGKNGMENAKDGIAEHLSADVGRNVPDHTFLDDMTPEELAAYHEKEASNSLKAGADWEQSYAEGDSMGAARVREPTLADYDLAGGKVIKAMAGNMNPIARLVKSASLAARKAALWLTDTPYYHVGHGEGKQLTAAGGSVESRIRILHDRGLVDSLQAINNNFDKYRGDVGLAARASTAVKDTLGVKPANGAMTYQEFKDAVGDALNSGGEHPVPEVAAAAQKIRESVYTPMLEQMNKLKMFGSFVDPETGGIRYNSINPNSEYARTYLNRIYDQAEIARTRRVLDANGNLVGGLEYKVLQHFLEKQKAAAQVVKKLLDRKGKLKSSKDLLEAESNLHSFDSSFKQEVDQVRGILKTDIDEENAGHIKTLLDLKEKPKHLVQAIKDAGGLFDYGGDLASRNIDNKSLPGLVTKKMRRTGGATGGLSEDTLREWLFNNDFKFGAHSYDDINLDTVYDAIADSVHSKTGGKVWDDNVTEALAGKAHDPEVVRELNDAGLTKKSTIADVENYVREKRGYSSEADFKAKREEYKQKVAEAQKVRNEELTKAKELQDFVDHDEETVLQAAQKTVDNIQGIRQGEIQNNVVPEGFLPQANFLRNRHLDMTNDQLGSYVVRDAEKLVRSYLQSTVPSMELTRTFGHDPLQVLVGKVRDDYAIAREQIQTKMRAAGDPVDKVEAEMLKSTRQEAKDIQDVTALVDKLMGKYGLPSDPNALWVRASKLSKQYNLLRMLGGMQVSALPDLARPIMVKGFMANARVLKSLMNGSYKLALDEAKKAQVAVEMLLNSRTNLAAGIIDDGSVKTGFEKTMEQLANNFGTLTGMSAHNQLLKGYSGVLIQDDILRAAHALHTGKALTKKQMRDAAKSGLGLDQLHDIAAEFNRGTIKNHKGLFVPDYDKFANYDTVRGMHSAINKTVNEIIVTVGKGEMPLWMSTELGSNVMQFKSFLVSSHHKVMISGLQQGDAAAAEGALVTLGLGAMVYALKKTISGQPISDDPATIAMEAADRSGMMTLPFEVKGIADKVSRGAVSRVLNLPTQSRFESRNPAGAVLGATVDLVGTGSAVTSAVTGAEMRDGDVRELRKAIPYQSLWYLNWLFSRIEDAGKDALVH